MNKREIKRDNKEIRKMLKEKYCEQKMVKVNDDWCPNYPNHTICVSLGMNWWNTGGGYAFIRAFGMDDTGVEMCAESNDFDDLVKTWNNFKDIYEKIPQTTNKRWYLDRGFRYV